MPIYKEPPDPPESPLPGGSGNGSSGSGGSASQLPAGSIGVDPVVSTDASQAVALPILWGTGKLTPLLIEKRVPQQVTPPLWQTSTQYAKGNVVNYQGSIIQCLNGGTSSSVNNLKSSDTPLPWTSGEVVVAGNVRSNGVFAYICLVGGTCGSVGPQSTLALQQDNPFGGSQPFWAYIGMLPISILFDGTLLVWKFIQNAPYQGYTQVFLGALCEGEVGNPLTLYWDKEQSACLSASTLGHGLQLLKGPDAGGQTLPAVTGVADAAEFTGSITTTVLNVTAMNSGSGAIEIGHSLSGTGVTAGTLISGFGTGNGGVGTYTVSISQTAASTAMVSGFSGTSFDNSGYQHTAMIAPGVAPSADISVSTGTMAELPAIALELQGVMFGVSTKDVNPADICTELVTHTRRGLGLSSSVLDASVGGSGAASMRTYCDAKGIRLTYLLDTQRPVQEIFADLFNAANCDYFTEQGVIKAVPRDDQNIPSPVYGSVAYVAPNSAAYDLGPTDFITSNGEPPVKITRAKPDDCFNNFPVEYIDRSSGYVTARVENPILTDVRKRGIKWSASPVSFPFIFDNGTIPVFLSRTLAQQSLANRNTYTFVLSWKYIGVGPATILTLTEPLRGLVKRPVRVMRRSQGADKRWTIIARDYAAGVAANSPYTPQVNDGYRAQDVPTLGTIPQAYPSNNQTNPYPDNLFPNSTSENPPPSAVVVLNDGSTPEFDFRLNIGSGASFTATMSGTQINVTAVAVGALAVGQAITGTSVPAGTKIVSFGTGIGGNGTYNTNTSASLGSTAMTAIGAYAGNWVRQMLSGSLGISVPCSPGERFYLAVQHRRMSGASGDAAISVAFLDSAGNTLSGGGAQTGLTALTWVQLAVTSTIAPANTVIARCSVRPAVSGGNLYQFDAFVFRRVVEAPMIGANPLPGQALVTDSITGLTTWAGDTSFTAPTLLNSWVNFGGSAAPTGYQKDALGWVTIIGGIKSGALANAAFVLPTGYRPSSDMSFACVSNGALGVGVVMANGNVIPQSGSTTAFDFGMIRFKAA